MELEKLSPPIFLEEVTKRCEELEELCRYLKSQSKTAPRGKLNLSRSNGTTQYYKRINGKRIYLSKKKMEIIKALAQAQYNQQTLQVAKNELRCLRKILRQFTEQKRKTRVINSSEYFYLLNSEIQKLITPVTQDSEQLTKKWDNMKFPGKEIFRDQKIFQTEKLETVRSKSEVIIANLLKSNDVPYHYEYPVKIGGTIFYPDFFCINLRTHKTYYWEHFGLLDDPNYAQNAVSKLNHYTQHNIIQGQNLIITTESSTSPLNPKTVQKNIDAFLK